MHPFKVQNKVFNSIIKKGRMTVFGKEHNFQKIKTYNSFKKQIPIRSYEKLYPYIYKSMQGKKNILWPGKVKWYAKSSGTTNSASKYIPITNDSLKECHFKAGKDMLSLYANNFPNYNLYNGKGIMLGGSISNSKSMYNTGDLSAILLKHFPFWVSYHRVPDLKTALMSNWEKKIELIADQAINENITNLTGVPSWMLLVLKKIMEKTKAQNLLDVWPNLELYMHGGVNFSPYQKIYTELIPTSKMNYMEGYNASEGFFAIQDKKNSDGMLLMLDYGIFYEFIALEEYKKGSIQTITLEDIELYKNYVIIISTNAGLWRYEIGDVVQFTSNHPYRLKVTGRTKHFINAFGEELIIENTDSALLTACNYCNCIINDYTVAPIFISKNSGGHQWFIEFKKKPKDIELFTTILDNELQNKNSDYKTKRENNLILKKPEIISLINNEFYIWLKESNKLGGQNKIPRLSNDRKLADHLLKINSKFSTKTKPI